MAFPLFLLICVILVNFGLAIFVLLRSKKQASAYSFAVLSLSVCVWAYTNAHFQITTSEVTAYGLSILSYISATTLVASMLYLSFIFPHYLRTKHAWEKHYKAIVLVPSIFFVLLALIPGGILKGVNIDTSPKSLETSVGLFGYAVHLVFMFILIFRNFIKNYRETSDIQKAQVRLLIVGLSSTIFFGTFFNLILPLRGNYSYIWLGPDFTIIMVALFAYAIVRHRLFSISIQLQNIINWVLPIGFAFGTGIGSSFLFHHINVWSPTMNGLVALALAFVMYKMMVYLVENTAFRYVLFQETYRQHQALKQLADIAPRILNIEQLIDRITDILVHKIGLQELMILVDKEEKGEYECLLRSNMEEDKGGHMQRLYAEDWDEVFSYERRSYLKEEIIARLQEAKYSAQSPQYRILLDLCTACHVELIIALFIGDKIVGFILLGKKAKGKSYTKEDLDLLEEISSSITIALLNSKRYQDTVLSNEKLQEAVSQATADLQEKLEENKQLLQVKTEFLRVISHQLRTPISAVRGALSLVLEDFFTEQDIQDSHRLQQARHFIKQAALANENLFDTSEHMLAASELMDEPVLVKEERLNAGVFFEERVTRANSFLDLKGNTLIFQPHLDETVPHYIHIDKKLLGNTIDLLLANAFLYTEEGTVKFLIEAKKNILTIVVDDSGIGIPKKEQHKLYQRFVRLPNAVNLVPDGSGLGLYLAQKYVQAMGGKISFESEEGKGTMFRLSIPYRSS